MSQPRDFWHDEAFQYLFSLKSIPYIMASNDVHPPLFNIFTKFLLTIGIDQIWQLRLIITILSIVFIIIFYYAIAKMFNKNTAILSSLFLALAPTYTFYATEFRSYTLAMIFVIAQIYFFNKKNLKYYTLFSFLMVATHYLTALIIFTQLIYSIIVKKLDQYFEYYAIAGIACIPIIAYLAFTIPKVETFWFKDIDFTSLISTFVYMFTPPLQGIVGWSLLYIIIIATAIIFRKKLDNMYLQFAMYATIPVITMWIISQFIPFYHHRYFLFGGIGIFILLAWGAIKWHEKIKDSHMAVVGFYFTLAIIGYPLLADTFDTELQDSALIIQNMTEYDVIHKTTFSQSPYKVYLPEHKHYLYTNLTDEQLFTAGGAVIDNKIESLTNLEKINNKYIIVDVKPYGDKVLYSEGGLYLSELIKNDILPNKSD